MTKHCKELKRKHRFLLDMQFEIIDYVQFPCKGHTFCCEALARLKVQELRLWILKVFFAEVNDWQFLAWPELIYMSTSWDSWRNGWLHPGYRCSNHTNSSMLCTNGTSFMKIIDDKGMFRLNVQKLVRLSAYIVQLKSSSACFAQQFCSRNKHTQECLTACRYGYVCTW